MPTTRSSYKDLTNERTNYRDELMPCPSLIKHKKKRSINKTLVNKSMIVKKPPSNKDQSKLGKSFYIPRVTSQEYIQFGKIQKQNLDETQYFDRPQMSIFDTTINDSTIENDNIGLKFYNQNREVNSDLQNDIILSECEIQNQSGKVRYQVGQLKFVPFADQPLWPCKILKVHQKEDQIEIFVRLFYNNITQRVKEHQIVDFNHETLNSIQSIKKPKKLILALKIAQKQQKIIQQQKNQKISTQFPLKFKDKIVEFNKNVQHNTTDIQVVKYSEEKSSSSTQQIIDKSQKKQEIIINTDQIREIYIKRRDEYNDNGIKTEKCGKQISNQGKISQKQQKHQAFKNMQIRNRISSQNPISIDSQNEVDNQNKTQNKKVLIESKESSTVKKIKIPSTALFSSQNLKENHMNKDEQRNILSFKMRCFMNTCLNEYMQIVEKKSKQDKFKSQNNEINYKLKQFKAIVEDQINKKFRQSDN